MIGGKGADESKCSITLLDYTITLDRHIVQWARANHEEHDYSCCEPEGPALVVESQLNTRLDYWNRVHWQFYVSWIE